jgi:hypothetical protein
MSFAAVLELVTLVAYVVIILGGKQKRETGWKVLCFILVLVGAVQAASMSIVVCRIEGLDVDVQWLMTGNQAYLYDNDEQFFPGWKLDKGWILCTVSWCIAILSAAFISISAYAFPPEAGYELIPSERYGGISG